MLKFFRNPFVALFGVVLMMLVSCQTPVDNEEVNPQLLDWEVMSQDFGINVNYESVPNPTGKGEDDILIHLSKDGKGSTLRASYLGDKSFSLTGEVNGKSVYVVVDSSQSIKELNISDASGRQTPTTDCILGHEGQGAMVAYGLCAGGLWWCPPCLAACGTGAAITEGLIIADCLYHT